MRILYFLLFVFYWFLTGCSEKNSPEESLLLLNKVKDENYSDNERLAFAKELNNRLNTHPDDSIKRQNLLEMTRLYYKKENLDSTISIAAQNLDFGIRAKDTTIITKSLNYIGNSHLSAYRYDSAYHYFYKSSRVFRKMKDSLGEGKALLNMSIIEKNKGDYVTAMKTSVLVEQLLKTSGENRLLASLYNNMGIITEEQKQYDQSYKYYKQSLELRNILADQEPLLKIESLNNIAVLFLAQKKYDSSFYYLNKAYQYADLKNHPKQWATISDNLGYTYFCLRKPEKAKQLLSNALHLRNETNDIPGKVVSYIHFSDFYALSDSKKSKVCLDSALFLSKKIDDSKGLMQSLKNHIQVSHPKDGYIQKLIVLQDSLLASSIANPNQLARIRYETDVLIEGKKHAEQEIKEKKNQLFNQKLISILLFCIVALVSALIYGIYKSYKNQSELYKDFNHRTRNYLGQVYRQITELKKISSLEENASLNYKIKELENTVLTLNLVFSMLEQQDKNDRKLFLDTYLIQLSSYIIRSFATGDVHFNHTSERIRVLPQQASVLGLIVNEFITNAYKYAFREKNRYNGADALAFHSDSIDENPEEKYSHFLNLAVNYLGSSHFLVLLKASGSYWNIENIMENKRVNGLNIMQSLAKQINARYEMSYENGYTILKLTIPAKITNG